MWAWRSCVWLLWSLPLASAQGVQQRVVLTSAPTPGGADAIVVGASAALDCCSTNAAYGRPTVQVWQLFITWLTQRGGILVNGTRRPLEIRVYDDQSSGTLVGANFQQHLRDGLSLFLGPFGSPATRVAAVLANASGALLLAPSASDPTVTAGRPTCFSFSPSASKFTTSALQGLAAKGAKTIAYVAENASVQLSWCRPLVTAAPAYGMNVTYAGVVPPNPTKNMTAAGIDAAMKASADVLFACFQTTGCLDSADVMVEKEYYPNAVLLPGCVTAPDFLLRGEPILWFSGTTPWMPSMPYKSTLIGWTAQQFTDRYMALYNALPPFQAVAAFAALEALVVAIEQANSTDVPKLAAQLRALNLDTVSGNMQFDTNQQVTLDFRGVQQTSLNAPPPIVSPLAFAQTGLRYPQPSAVERKCLSQKVSEFGYDSTGVCVQCPAGYTSVWNTSAGVRSCFFCPPGNFYMGGSQCSACPAGTITISAGQQRCTNCTRGTYSPVPGQSLCVSCEAGTFGAVDGATACLACAAGKYNNQVQQTLCRDCLAGTYGAQQGALTCRPCEAGTYTEFDGMDSCTPCSGGRITASLGAFDAGACVCAKGAYLQDGACNQCPPLQSTDDLGATSKSACALNDAARAMVAVIVTAAVVFPLCFWGVWARMKRKLREAERLRLLTLQQQLDTGLKSIKEFQHPMVVVSAATFLQLTDADLAAAHERAREKGQLKTFDTVSEVAEYRLRNPSCKIVLFSYEWLSWRKKGPDALQATRMRNSLTFYCRKIGTSLQNVFVWLDVLSIPQVNAAVQILAVNSLYTYAASADALIVIAPPSEHEGSGVKANLETYKSRVWTRMELVAQVAAHGIESVFISTDTDLNVATAAFVEEIMDIFSGNMTCCRLKHKGRNTCDKETLVSPLLGVWYLLSGGAGPLTNSGAVFLHRAIQAKLTQVFPTNFAFATEKGVEQRPLFGDLIPMLEKHLRQQKQVQPDIKPAAEALQWKEMDVSPSSKHEPEKANEEWDSDVVEV